MPGCGCSELTRSMTKASGEGIAAARRLITRREVLKGGAALGAGVAGSLMWPATADVLAAPAGPIDTVLLNGFVFTVDERSSVAQAIAIDHGIIVFVGSNAAAQRYIGRNTEVIDLQGRMVMPGIHEGHIHGVTNPDQPPCDLGAGPLTVSEFQAKVQECLDDPRFHRGTPGAPDDFLIAENLYFQFLRPAGTVPHKSMLDALNNPANRPIIVTAAVTGHNILVNQAALDLAGITRDTPDPIGGRIDHDPDGEPSGILQDSAGDLVWSHVPPPPEVSFERRVQLAGDRMREFSQEGITSFFVPGFPADPGTLAVFQALRDQGGLTARAHFAIYGDTLTQTPDEIYDNLETMRAEFERSDEIPLEVRSWRPGRQVGPKRLPQPGVSIDGVKLFMDGIVQFPAQTGYMSSPYLDADGNPRTDEHAQGELYQIPEVLNEVVAELERRGFQSHIHAIGDLAVTLALDALAHARAENPRIRAHQTIAHAEMVNPVDYERFGRLDVTASMGLQWAKPAPDSTEAVKPFVGDRWDWYEPTVPITDGGGRVSLGSDCCLDPFDEWFDLEVAILREADWGPEFPQFEGKLNALPGLSLEHGIRAITVNGAYQMHQQKITGSLETGKLADLVVLNQNLTHIPLDDIGKTDVLMTMVGGQVVWQDQSF
jgi:predicted amidohydrolase YtcJ